jgi:hypothetical protein
MRWMRRTWSDARLDDLNGKVDRIDVDMRAEFDSLHRLMLQIAAVVIAALIGLIATISSVAITQL